MSDVEPVPEPPLPGWCAICGTTVEGDLTEHMENAHPVAARKIRAAKMSWQDRLHHIISLLEKVEVESDRQTQIDGLDAAFQEMYLVRQRLAHLKGGIPVMRVREGNIIKMEED